MHGWSEDGQMRRGRNDSRRVRHDLRLAAHSHWIVPEQELLLVLNYLMHGFAFYSHFFKRTATSAVTEVGKMSVRYVWIIQLPGSQNRGIKVLFTRWIYISISTEIVCLLPMLLFVLLCLNVRQVCGILNCLLKLVKGTATNLDQSPRRMGDNCVIFSIVGLVSALCGMEC